ncbi:MAG TPA: hypothetical protein DCL77_16670 [Prolixibacteraceae bacterium]|jgi:hypothetical protein|nr:hypothetical protein [Prolixibacteraceae bacterium]
MKLSILTLMLMLFAVSIVSAQKEDKKKAASGAITGPVEGVVYSLPETGIRVHVKATRERFVHGPFSQYAQKMLGIDNVPQADADRWNMDEMQLEVFSEPDPDQVHKALGKAAQMVSLTESGILAGINTDMNIDKSILQTSSFLLKNLDQQSKFTDLSIWSYYSPADSTKKFKMVSKNQEQKAAEAAETIFNLRNSRFALLTNADDEPLPDGKSFEIMTEELGRMEDNYLALFIGKSDKQSYEFSFDFVPGQKSVKGEVFFRFSEDRGVLPKTDLSGRPIVIDVVKSEGLSTKQGALSASDNPFAGKSGLYYRMPGMAEIRIMDGSNQLATSRTAIAQFGTTAPIPEDILDGNFKLEFFPNTGAVKSITEK